MTTNACNCKWTEDQGYKTFLESIQAHFLSVVQAGATVAPLFTTDVDTAGLFKLFLESLPASERQHHVCHACRHFVHQYGGLVVIDGNGRTRPVLWGPAPGMYEDPFHLMRHMVASARVTGVFLSTENVWGQPRTGEWTHMAVCPPKELVYRGGPLKTAGQAMAEKREEYRMLQRALAEYPKQVVLQAKAVLEAEALYRGEKCLGVAQWLERLISIREGCVDARARENVTWKAVAGAPPGFCHVRSTMIGTLLDDLATGTLSFEDVKRRFADKMDPLQYQRPQAAPSAGNIAQAEKVVATLKSAGALRRRFARLEEIEAIWRPEWHAGRSGRAGEAHHAAGVFSHLTPKGKMAAAPLTGIPSIAVTWVKFRDEVLPKAEKIEFMPHYGKTGYIAILTAEDMSAPPILQWDSLERRNPFNWYVYPLYCPEAQHGNWGMRPGVAADVAAVTLLPCNWHRPSPNQGEGVIFVLRGCRDMNPVGGLALFPEVLRSEYHAVRSTIEAYSRAGVIGSPLEASACGVDLRKGSRHWGQEFIVTTAEAKFHYILDRWD